MDDATDQGQVSAWEDINPPMVSAPRHGLPSQSSDDEARTVFRNELTACLALTAPVGMTEESRREWLAVAWDTLKHIDPDDLATCARLARQTCDHPAKVVPAIIKAREELRPWEKFIRHEPDAPKQIEAQYVTPDEAAEILREVGLKPAAEQ